MAKIQKNVAEDIYGPFVRLFEEGVLKVRNTSRLTIMNDTKCALFITKAIMVWE